MSGFYYCHYLVIIVYCTYLNIGKKPEWEQGYCKIDVFWTYLYECEIMVSNTMTPEMDIWIYNT